MMIAPMRGVVNRIGCRAATEPIMRRPPMHNVEGPQRRNATLGST